MIGEQLTRLAEGSYDQPAAGVIIGPKAVATEKKSRRMAAATTSGGVAMKLSPGRDIEA
jgi:hypothetical protein